MINCPLTHNALTAPAAAANEDVANYLTFAKDVEAPKNKVSSITSNGIGLLEESTAAACSVSMKASAHNIDGIESSPTSRVNDEQRHRALPPPMSIAAMAAAAARKKNAKSATDTHEAKKDRGVELSASSTVTDESMTNRADLPAFTNTCGACNKYMDKTQFSKSQLAKAKKNEIVRCKLCIETQRPAPSKPNPSQEKEDLEEQDTSLSCTTRGNAEMLTKCTTGEVFHPVSSLQNNATIGLTERQNIIITDGLEVATNEPNTAAGERKQLMKCQGKQRPLLISKGEFIDEDFCPSVEHIENTPEGRKDGDIERPASWSALNEDDDANNEVQIPLAGKPPTNHADLTFSCSACGERLEKSQFSKNQLSRAKKNQVVRCKKCINLAE